MIISFAHTTPALLAGKKTVTRRDWKPGHAAKFHSGLDVDAWDRSPRVKRARRVAEIRIVSVRLEPIQRLLDDPRYAEIEWRREGGRMLWPSPDEFIGIYRYDPAKKLYRVEFFVLNYCAC